MLDEVQPDRQWRLVVGVEVEGDERVQITGGHRPRPEGVLQPQAEGVNQVPADRHPIAALLTGDNHVGQTAVQVGAVEIDIRPLGMPGHRQPTAPPRTHPATHQLVRVGGGLLCGHGPHQRRHPRGGDPDRTSDLLGRTSLGPQRAHPLDQLVIRAHLPGPSPAALLGSPAVAGCCPRPCLGEGPQLMVSSSTCGTRHPIRGVRDDTMPRQRDDQPGHAVSSRSSATAADAWSAGEHVTGVGVHVSPAPSRPSRVVQPGSRLSTVPCWPGCCAMWSRRGGVAGSRPNWSGWRAVNAAHGTAG